MANEISDKELKVSTRLNVSTETELYLRSAAKWSFFLAIIGFIIILLQIISGITLFVLSTVQNEYSDFQNLPIHIPFVFLGVLYLLFAVLCFFPIYNFMTFGNKIKLAFETNDQSALDEGLKDLKRVFKFFGIITIVIISVSIILIPTIMLLSFSKGMVH